VEANGVNLGVGRNSVRDQHLKGIPGKIICVNLPTLDKYSDF